MQNGIQLSYLCHIICANDCAEQHIKKSRLFSAAVKAEKGETRKSLKRVGKIKKLKIMKKVIIGAIMVMGISFTSKSQEVMVNTTEMLQRIGYTINTSDAVIVGQANGHTIYRTNYITNGRCKGKGRWFCKQCPGCCRSGYVDYDETGRIYSVNVDGQNGQLFYLVGEDADYFVEQSQL